MFNHIKSCKKSYFFMLIIMGIVCIGSCKKKTKINTTNVSNVVGVVKNESNMLIANAQISLGDKSTTSNTSGRFEFTGVAAGNYTLIVKATGYNDYQKEISISTSGGTTTLDTILLTTTNNVVSVYAVGRLSAGPAAVATYWKDGIKQTLTNATGYEAKGVFVSDNNVYIIGSNNNSMIAPVLWTNGTEQKLTNNNRGLANGIYIANNKIYIAGVSFPMEGSPDRTTLWTNGVLSVYQDAVDDASTFGESVYVSGSNIYVAGLRRTLDDKTIALLWINGTLTELSNATDNAEAFSIHGNGNEVYIGGLINEMPVIWKKDGTKQDLNLPSGYTNRLSNLKIFVANNIVYACGNAWNTANNSFDIILWKNGTPSVIANDALSAALHVVGNDVYIGGEQNKNGVPQPTLWKNGTIQTLENSTNEVGSINDIFVK